MSQKITISLVSGASEEQFRLCLKYLLAALEHFEYELIVTDNSSPFDVRATVGEFFKGVRILTNGQAQSFAKNQNRVLRETESDYILMLRDEALLLPSSIHKMKVCLDRSGKTALAAPAFFYGSLYEKPEMPGAILLQGVPATVEIPFYSLIQEVGGDRFYRSHMVLSDLRDKKLTFVRSLCFLARREVLLAVGGYDEGYANSGAGLDLGHRLRAENFDLYQAEEAKCLLKNRPALSRQSWQEVFEGWRRYNQKYHRDIVGLFTGLFENLIKIALELKGNRKEPASLKRETFTKILVYKRGDIKDFLFITPAIKALRRRFPDSKIILFSTAQAELVLKDNADIDEIRLLPEVFLSKPFTYLWPPRFTELKKYLKELRLEKWDLFISFEDLFSWWGAIRLWILSKFSEAPWRVGLDTDGRGFFLSHKVIDERESFKHATRKYLDAVSIVGAVPEDLSPQMVLTPEEEEWGAAWLKERGVTQNDFLLAVFAGASPDRLQQTSWPKDYFVQTLNQLAERHGAKLLMITGTDSREVNWAHYIRDKVTPVPVLTEPGLGLRETASILKHTCLLIANDSDLLHLTLALGVPAVGIFGPSDYQLYGSYGDEVDLTVFFRKIDCRPCVNFACSDPICMKSITPEIVIESVSKKMESLQGLCSLKPLAK